MSFTWQRARLLTSVNDNISYSYDSDGNRKTKTVNGTETEYYYLNGTLRAQKTGNTYILFMYDENGAVYGLKVYENGTPTYYHFIFNLQGDVIGILDGNSRLVVNYEYDEWGNILSITDARGNAITDANHIANLNPIRYRGYYYDTETGFYYLQSRYYDPQVGRFINADGVIAGTSNSTQGYNIFSYCVNNPVNMSDSSGNWPKWIETAANWVNNNIIQPVKNFFSSPKQSNVVNASSHDANRRPYNGEPGSTYTAPNGDSRTYGPDGTPEHDYDHDDHGRPDKHPRDPNGGHNHDWENGVRGPAYSVGWEPIVGASLVTVCVIGIVVVAADDATGIGVADDFLFGPLGAGIREGLILIFG